MTHLHVEPLDDVAARRDDSIDAHDRRVMRGVALDSRPWALVRGPFRERLLPLADVPARRANRVVLSGMPVLTVPHGVNRINGDRGFVEGPRRGLAYHPSDGVLRSLAAAAGVLLSAGLESAELGTADGLHRSVHDAAVLDIRHVLRIEGLRAETTLLYLASDVEHWAQYVERFHEQQRHDEDRWARRSALEKQAKQAATKLDQWLATRTDGRVWSAYVEDGGSVMPVRVTVRDEALRAVADHARAALDAP